MARTRKTKLTEDTGAVKASENKEAVKTDEVMAAEAETVKVETAKAETAKEETAKAEPVTSSTPEKPAESPKERKQAAKAAASKSAEDKQTAKKAVAKKEIKVKATVQYQGKQVEEKDMIGNVKKDWTKKSGRKVRDIKSIDLYIKPEDDQVYYVINGTDTGSVAF